MANIIIERVTATVRALFIKSQKGARSTSVASVRAIEGGFEGDRHLGTKRRQILLISGTVMDELSLQPGTLQENVVIDGLDVMAFEKGQQLRLGDAVVAVTIPCEPCGQMERIRPGLRAALQNRRGMFVRVVTPGAVRVGDRMEAKL